MEHRDTVGIIYESRMLAGKLILQSVCVCVCVCCFLVGCRLGRKDLAAAADAAACCANVCCAIRGFVTSIRVDYAIIQRFASFSHISNVI